ncbi:MAG TPA: hypothetical protein VFE58_03970 [Tepidisphaeraceae bacterium]|nr:hypothetical protein [Tepidisphaeraceae bacterium]
MAFSFAPIAHAALLPVVEYDMVDGAEGNGWYNDNSYTGTNTAGYLTGGVGQLTDGSKGNDIGYGYSLAYPYLYWPEFNPEIIFNLGSPSTLTAINTYFLIHNPSATYLPDHVDLSFSFDGSSWSPPITRTFTLDEQYPDPPNNVAETNYQLLSTPQTAQYIKLTYIRSPDHEWMAIDEIEFTGTPLPEPTLLLLTTLTLFISRKRRR